MVGLLLRSNPKHTICLLVSRLLRTLRNATLCVWTTPQKHLSADPSMSTASEGPRFLGRRSLLGEFERRDIRGQIKTVGRGREGADAVPVSK